MPVVRLLLLGVLISCGAENPLEESATKEETTFEKARKSLDQAAVDDKGETEANFCQPNFLFEKAIAEEKAKDADAVDQVVLAKSSALLAAVKARLSGLSFLAAVLNAGGGVADLGQLYDSVYGSVNSLRTCADAELGAAVARETDPSAFLVSQASLLSEAITLLDQARTAVASFDEVQTESVTIDVSLSGTVYSAVKTSVLYKKVFVNISDRGNITPEELAAMSEDDVASLIVSLGSAGDFAPDTPEGQAISQTLGEFKSAIDSAEGTSDKEKLANMQKAKE